MQKYRCGLDCIRGDLVDPFAKTLFTKVSKIDRICVGCIPKWY